MTRGAAFVIVVVVAAGLGTLASSQRARACAACQTGDPTLTAFGTEAGYDGRVRLALDVRTRHDTIGRAGRDRLVVQEVRSELGLAWAPVAPLFLQLALPLLVRDVGYVDDAHELVMASGDVALRVRVELAAGLSLSAGVSLPTAPVARRDGQRLPIEAQPGTGSVDPSLGLAWAWSELPWAVGVSAWGTYPTGDANASLRTTAFAQYELWRQRTRAVALRVTLDGRLDGRAMEAGRVEPDSGGFVLFAGGDVVVAPAMDLVVTLGMRAPLVDALRGAHDEAVFGVASLAYDLW